MSEPMTEPPADVVERVARAMAARMDMDWDTLRSGVRGVRGLLHETPYREFWLRLARAALAAMPAGAVEELAAVRAVVPASLLRECSLVEAVKSTFDEFVKAAAEVTRLKAALAAMPAGATPGSGLLRIRQSPRPLETGLPMAHIPTMPDKRLPRPRDPAQLAKLMIDIASGEVEDRAPDIIDPTKDPAAVSLGRRGGLKGGRARADKLSPDKRSQIARDAAKARWDKPSRT